MPQILLCILILILNFFFLLQIRSQGSQPTTKEILKFAKLFENEITLDNMSRQQMQAVCKVLNIQPIGIDALLRFQLDMKLRQLKADDKVCLCVED
jgi:LETM1 and EF-hand domain-containing protein 1